MSKKLLSLSFLFLLFINSISFAQGILRGKISDENGEALIGVNVTFKSNKSIGCITDFDGNYSLKIPDSTVQSIVISYISYQTIETKVQALKGNVVAKNFVMKSSQQALKEVEIVAKATKSKDYYMESLKKKSATTIDYVSSESMKKTGDANVTSAVSRVSGVSTNGGFITVRGIGDRYVKTAINGSRIPTLDPFTNNIKLDLFPSSLVDNVLITKTASPDLSGDWSGAYLSVETKDYPEKFNLTVETSFGYNAQTSFKNVLSSERSSTDWLGFDNNLRDYDHNTFKNVNINPTQYEVLSANGLESYYNSIGVTQNSPWNETYFKLGLVQLGLLAPALINDADAYSDAKTMFEKGSYNSEAFQKINAEAVNSTQAFAANWNTQTRSVPLDFSQSFSIGNQTELFGKPLGLIGGFRYGSSTLYDGKSEANRASVSGDGNGNLVNTVASSIKQEQSREMNGWRGLLNAALKLNSNNSISFLFMPNFAGVNNVRSSLDNRDQNNFVWTKSQFYEQRKQLVYQIKTENYLPHQKIKIEFNSSFTNGKSKAPDFKNLQYYEDPNSNAYQIGGTIGDGIHRYYRYLTDNLFDSRIYAEMPLSDSKELIRKIKVGAAYQYGYKISDQYDYSVNFSNYNSPLYNDDINAYLSQDKFGIISGVNQFGNPYSSTIAYYSESGTPANNTFGKNEIGAGFAMIDYSFTPKIRVSGGLRYEKANIFTDVVLFDSLNYPVNDTRRDYANGLPAANPGKLAENSFLPSVNIIYKLRDDEQYQANIRLNYSKTVARPSIRELSDVAAFDYEFRSFIFGNSSLKSVQINNYDFRMESYFKSGDNISASVFYKDFKNHIELVNSSGYSWQNVDKSIVLGIELDGRKIINKNFEFRSNITFVKSNTEFVRKRMEISGSTKQYIPIDTISRQMYGQAPYVLNAILSYTSDSAGFTATITYNVQGPRLVIASDVREIPDVFELPRNLIDLKISKNLGRHFTTSLTVRNILDSPIRRSYDFPEGYTLDYDKFRYGTNFILGLIYKL